MENKNERERSASQWKEQFEQARRAEIRHQRRKRAQRQRVILGLAVLLVVIGIVVTAVLFLGRKDDAVQENKTPDVQNSLQENLTNLGDEKNGYTEKNADTPNISDTADTSDAQSAGNTVLQLSEADKYTGDLILVNADYRYHVEENSASVQLVYVADAKGGDYTVSGPEVQLAGRIIAPLDRMIAACEEETGSRLTGISSAYRSIEYQQDLYEEYTNTYGLEYAQAYVANPGYSEHHTGLAMDLSIYYEDGSEGTFSTSAEAVWYADNSYRFGFVRRYQASKTEITGISNEEWHFRYVGIPHAYYMYQHDLCLEEYVDWLRRNTSESSPVTQVCGDETYEIFFTTNTSVSLPKDSEYSVSGNNVDGYVIAYRMK